MSLSPTVAEAITELTETFSGHRVEHRPDGQGGAAVIVHDLPLGPAWSPDHSWVGFVIPSLYPRADVYPHFVCTELRRADGRPLASPLNGGHVLPVLERQGVMLSRRSNRWDPSRDTAALKLHRILLWFAEQGARQVAA